MFLFALLIASKLVSIQLVDGDKYRELALKNTIKNVVIPANRGNVYADDGSLLATSVPKYGIRFDAVTASSQNFNDALVPLSKELSILFGKQASYYQKMLRKARAEKNQYLFIARNLDYSDYITVKRMPLFKLGRYKGGIIVEPKTVREHPIGNIAERLIGSENKQKSGYYAIGLEGAFNDELEGKAGRRHAEQPCS